MIPPRCCSLGEIRADAGTAIKEEKEIALGNSKTVEGITPLFTVSRKTGAKQQNYLHRSAG